MRSVAVLLVLASVGCTVDNPEYVPGPGQGDGPAPDLSVGPPVPDLRAGSPDLAGCSPKERRCRQMNDTQWVSQYCQQGRWADDRRCPTNSACGLGYCQHPPRQGTFEGKPCVRENDCFSAMQPTTSFSCQPFVRLPDLAIEGYCTTQVSPQGTGFPGTTCTPPDGQGCRSGFCDEVAHTTNGMSVNYCFRACVVGSDCPNTGRFTCAEAKVLVEQVPLGTSRSCVLN